ncbi:hypothetical protein ACW6AV_002926 [Edwardsiella piscicida]|uniref:Uncharacterized protein n=5 Tax=Edwardsiella TaxID=635 RepID=A0A0H3DUA5_EDWTF|nr:MULTISPECIES: hypothetical protein [Edwardsiella]ACY85853.1 hypothetical protein ETAE_3020 [Edwardsiella tarda EIB202]ADM42852.1 hypothetical protein ETAF_2748 [Edwardsiella tarda FL6-60]AIJ07711.1 Hypothetical protein ETEE_1254 [Edwardsiella anguillarum ET080813]ARD18763.1 hypothetical protein BXA22_10640 [Edwardsiella piscicida]ELM3737725.1 hypothetical protein [Edwardsiella piscicida]
MWYIDTLFPGYIGSPVVNRTSSASTFDSADDHHPQRDTTPASGRNSTLGAAIRAFSKRMAEKRRQRIIDQVDALIP